MPHLSTRYFPGIRAREGDFIRRPMEPKSGRRAHAGRSGLAIRPGSFDLGVTIITARDSSYGQITVSKRRVTHAEPELEARFNAG